MGIESGIGRFHFGKVEEEIYCRTVHRLVKRPSGNTGRRIGALVNSHSSAWWLHPNCIDQEGEWLKHALDEIRSGFDIDLNLRPGADFTATIHSPALYTCLVCVCGSVCLCVSLSLKSSLLKKQAESNSTSTLFSVNKSWLYSYGRLYKHGPWLLTSQSRPRPITHACWLAAFRRSPSPPSFSSSISPSGRLDNKS